MVLKRIKYISRFSRDLSRDEVDTLVRRAQEKNARLGLTGLLITTGQLFYQVIEGPKARLDPLFEVICADPRHTELLVLSVKEEAATRFFPDWAMQKMDLAEATDDRLEPLRELLSTIVESRLRTDRLANTLERAILRELTLE